MQLNFKAPRGTKDILPEEEKIWQLVEQKAIDLSQKFGFFKIKTPTFESADLFNRSVGQITDIVEKEMFTFTDRGNRVLALKPEGTAGTVRAIFEGGLVNDILPVKVCYISQCFRNERPQAGRFKEFTQFGVELFGSKSPHSEIEIISLANLFFEELKIKNLNLEINSIGCSNCRLSYCQKLLSYYKDFEDELCETCLKRLEKNPLKLLDCKIHNCAKISKNAPKIIDYLCGPCKDEFSQVCDLLEKLKIEYVLNPSIVRGLDYYNGTVFEFTSSDLGAQKTICGGGRYNKLTELIGGVNIPALGFGIGLDRLILLMKLQKNELTNFEKECDLFIASIGKEALTKANLIALTLRRKGFCVSFDLLEKSLKAQMRYADKICASFSCVIGESELNSNKVIIKNMQTKDEFEVCFENFIESFEKIYCN